MVGNSLESQSFPGFSIAMILDSLHSVVILYFMKHLLRIVSSHQWCLGQRFASSFTKISSLPAALLLHNIVTPFLYYSLKWYTIEASSYVAGDVQDASAWMAPLPGTSVH